MSDYSIKNLKQKHKSVNKLDEKLGQEITTDYINKSSYQYSSTLE